MKTSSLKGWMTAILLLGCLWCQAHSGPALRRPISPSMPAWIIHIDVWNTADPQKIIDMVPEDIRPFVIFNISTSSSDNLQPSGSAIYDSWMKVCAQNRVWTMIQCASGAYNRMPDDGSTEAYEQYFKDYPNFLGFNFAEQFWGFGTDGHVSFPERLQLFADLLPICHQYGGYLAVSFTDSYYNASKMPIAYMKRNAQLRNFLTKDNAHFLCFEKYTLKKNFLDIESNCLGAWLGGYAGQYGIRFDTSGWLAATDVTDQTKGASDFVKAVGAIPVAEHVMLTGQTIIDGPELVPYECSREVGTSTTDDGFTRRNWAWYPQFVNVNIDAFRKILDGTFRIPTRQEVIERTKVCIVNDINQNLNNEQERDSYVTPATLFDGLYRSATDQGGLATENRWLDNRWWLKSTGRYPTIPQVYALLDDDAKQLTSVYKSQYAARWNSTEAKVAEFNTLFPEEYTGDIYAGRLENAWVTYNPYQYDESVSEGYRICAAATRRAKGRIPFQYNTCDSVVLDEAPYTLAVMKEYINQVSFYLTNYQVTTSGSTITEKEPVEDVIRIYGASQRPTYQLTERGSHQPSSVTTQWKNGVYVMTIRHNGALDVTIYCGGKATGRKTVFNTAYIEQPEFPDVYKGTRQYEAEHADYKSLKCIKNGYGLGHDGYYGQGYVEMTGEQSILRDSIMVTENDYYQLTLRYQADADAVLNVTGSLESCSISASACDSWQEVSAVLKMEAGAHPLTVQNTGSSLVRIDCIQLSPVVVAEFTPDAQGEYHVPFDKLIGTGSVTVDAVSGKVTLAGDTQQTGSMKVLFRAADFSNVSSIKLSYEDDGDIFRYLIVSDQDGNSVNPSGNKGAFWSSKYNLNYTDYQKVAASKTVSKLEWFSTASSTTPRVMTLKDILIKTQTPSGMVTQHIYHNRAAAYYNLQGQQTARPQRGLCVVKMTDGTVRKQLFE